MPGRGSQLLSGGPEPPGRQGPENDSRRDLNGDEHAACPERNHRTEDRTVRPRLDRPRPGERRQQADDHAGDG